MKRRRVLAVTLPVLSGIAIVGAGFSAWHFGDSSFNSSTSLDVEISDAYNAGVAFSAVSCGSKITLDQGTTSGGTGITYSKDTYVVLGYVTEYVSGVTKEPNISVSIDWAAKNENNNGATQQTENLDSTENAVVTEETPNHLTTSDITICPSSNPSSQFFYTFTQSSHTFAIYAYIYTNINDTGADTVYQAIESALNCQVSIPTSTGDVTISGLDIKNTTTTASTAYLDEESQPSFSRNDLPILSYVSEPTCMPSYRDLKAKADNSKLQFNATVSLSQDGSN